MAIYYKYRGIQDSLNPEEKKKNGVYPRAVALRTVDKEGLTQYMAEHYYHNKPMAAMAVEAVFSAITELIKDGAFVKIDGWGSFQPTLSYIPQVEGNSRTLGTSLMVKDVNFRAAKEFIGKLNQTTIRRADSQMLSKRGLQPSEQEGAFEDFR